MIGWTLERPVVERGVRWWTCTKPAPMGAATAAPRMKPRLSMPTTASMFLCRYGEARLSTWLHRIAVNAALMRLRCRKRRAECSIDDLLPRFDEDGSWASETSRVAPSSHELVERGETRRFVRACIDRLPESARTVLMMRDIEDLDTDEAAELLGSRRTP